MDTPNPSAQADFYTAQMNRAIARHDDSLTHELVELAGGELAGTEALGADSAETRLARRTSRRDRSGPRAWQLMHRVDAWSLWALNARTDRRE